MENLRRILARRQVMDGHGRDARMRLGIADIDAVIAQKLLLRADIDMNNAVRIPDIVDLDRERARRHRRRGGEADGTDQQHKRAGALKPHHAALPRRRRWSCA